MNKNKKGGEESKSIRSYSSRTITDMQDIDIFLKKLSFKTRSNITKK